MASYRNMPMAAHDMDELSGQEIVDAFRELIVAQEEVAEMLQDWAQRDRKMLDGA